MAEPSSGPPAANAVTVAIVSYNVAALLERCISSVYAAGPELDVPLDLVVVDNASSDDSALRVRTRCPQARLIANPTNVGFGAACNQALASAGRSILFLNPDAELAPGALRALLDRLGACPRAALVGPRLVFPDGRPQPSRRRHASLAALLVEHTPLEWRGRRWRVLERLQRAHYAGEPERGAEPVPWVSGACLLARTEALRQCGGFDPAFFMYFEEVDLSRRLAAHGWETWYEPAATVIHHHSRSADLDLLAKDRHFYSSKYRYVSRYWGPVQAKGARLLAAGLFGAQLLAQIARRDRRLAARYAALVRWHLWGDT
jgi:GT2 family glycosyltransferase